MIHKTVDVGLVAVFLSIDGMRPLATLAVCLSVTYDLIPCGPTDVGYFITSKSVPCKERVIKNLVQTKRKFSQRLSTSDIKVRLNKNVLELFPLLLHKPKFPLIKSKLKP